MTFREYLLQNGIYPIKEFPIKTKVVSYRKGEVVSPTGEIEKNIYFIVSGKVIAEMIKGKKRVVIDFFFSDSLFTSGVSMLNQEPSQLQHKCLSNCKIEIIPYQEIVKACETSLVANKFLIHFLKTYYLTRAKKERDIVSKNVEQRYNELIKERPELLKNVSITDLALYLNVHPGSLSRLKKQWVIYQKTLPANATESLSPGDQSR